MKLANVFMAKEAMSQLAQAKLAPKVAYRVLKFAKKFEAEFGIVESQRVAILREVAEVKEGEDAKIEPGTPEMTSFFEKFAPVLDTDCELEACPLKFDALMDALDSEEGNVLSAQDLALLEPLFESDEEVKPDLEIVK